MVELRPVSPFFAMGLPVTIGGLVIDEVHAGPVLSVMPSRGCEAEVSRALGELPNIGGVVRGEVDVFWSGLNQWFVSGGQVTGLDDIASVTDQSDAWAVLSIRGASAQEVMARLCPLDLRAFGEGQVARTEFAHMMSIILPRAGGYDIWVMRSFATTALHHLKEAAASVEAVKSLPS